MRLLFLTDNFPPEVNAPATRTYDHCVEWAKEGVEVTVITCFPNFPDGKVYSGYKNKMYASEIIDGVRVIRVWTYIAANKGTIKRAIDFFSFCVASFLVGMFIKTDLIVATSPQFFTALSGRWLSFVKRKNWVMEVRDLWPESIKAVGAMKGDRIYSFFKWLELRLYISASKIITVTDSFKRNLVKRGIDSEKIVVVKNGVNRDLYYPQEVDQQLKSELGIETNFLIGYIGTHGMAHNLDFVIRCARRLENDGVTFLFVGSGAKKGELVELAKDLRLSNVKFLDSVPKDQVSRYISILDAMVVPLMKSELFKTVIPSKIFETAAMGKPIILGVDGEAREIVESYQAGVYYEPENENEFVGSVMNLATDNDLYNVCVKGCTLLAADFERKVLSKKMHDAIKVLA